MDPWTRCHIVGEQTQSATVSGGLAYPLRSGEKGYHR